MTTLVTVAVTALVSVVVTLAAVFYWYVAQITGQWDWPLHVWSSRE